MHAPLQHLKPLAVLLHDEEEPTAAATATAPAQSMPSNLLQSTHHVDAFTPLGTLGRGNMGTVFLVLSNSTPFALKITRSLSSSKKQRSHIERDILSSLHHPFLQTLHAHFELGNHSLFLLDFCSGGDLNLLRHRQPEKRFSETAARFYAAEVLVALEHLHKLGVVYRDLKPENILVQGSGHIKLTDFDLSLNLGAKIRGAASVERAAPDKRWPAVGSTLQQHIIAEASSEKAKQGAQLHAAGVVSSSTECILAKDLEEEEEDLVSVDRDVEASECTILRRKRDAKQTCNFCRLQCLGLNWGLSRESQFLGASKKKKVKRVDRPRVDRPRMTQSCFRPVAACVKSKDCKDVEERYVSVVGTDEYVAPEVLRGEEHGFSMDWWSFGVLLYEMIYGHTPFKESSSERTLTNILEKEAELPGMKTPAKNLIAQLLVKDPAARLGAVAGAHDIKQHPFFCSVNWDSLPYICRPPFIPPTLCLSELEESYSAKLKTKREGITHGMCKSWLDEVVERIEAADNVEGASSQYSRSSSSAGFQSSSADGVDRELRRDDDVDALFSSAEWSRELEAGKHTPLLI